jgi:hypothetical protein
MDRTGHIKTKFRDGRDCYQVERDGCWMWRGATNDRGYPQMELGGRTVYAHRHYYTEMSG